PLLGMFCLVILYFIFADTPLTGRALKKTTDQEALSHHHVNQKIMAGLVSSPATYSHALREHISFLKHLFPRDAGDIDAQTQAITTREVVILKESTFLSWARFLLNLHKTILHKHGRKVL
ncbi:MAG: hypothetical protein HQM16_17285, partial [Deltaproteobacteria bacterium]|nr:hypothetical protein [Deltaproteobacteria bacterium]